MKTLREMQDSLYAKAKTEKDAKFNTLMDKICRTDVLKEAWNLVYENRGSPGIDGESVKHAGIQDANVTLILHSFMARITTGREGWMERQKQSGSRRNRHY